MDIQDKSREELLIELEELQKAHDFLKCTLEAEFQDRKNTEDALRRSEDHLTITLHSIGDAVLSTDKEGLVVQMNPVAEELCGWQLSEAIGKPLSDVFFIVNAETRKPVADPVKKVLELGEIVGLANHTVLISRNGAEFHISDSAAPIKNKEDEISGVVLVFSDVTENYTAQMLIKENEQRYRSLLNNLEAGIVVHAPDTSIVMNNFRASELLGLTEDQMRGKEAIDPAWNFIDEDLKPMPLNEYPVNRILNQRKPLQNQILGIHQPGKEELVWVTVNGFPVIDNQGEFVEIVISFIDITDSKNAEKTIKQRERELRRHNELFDSLINNLPIGVFMVEVPSGKPLIANESALRLLGRGILPSASKHNLAEVYQAFKKDTGQPYPLEEMPIVQGMNGVTSYIDDMIILRPDGSKTNVEIFGSPVKDDEGNVWASLVSFSEITERKMLEDIQNFLLTCGYPGSDENFFESLAKYLSKTLNAEYVCIDKLEGDGLTAQTLAIYNEGNFEANVSYTLKQTPCGDVVGKHICCFPANVCQLFPNDAALQELKAQSYIGTTLWSFDGKPIGLIAIISQKPMENAAFAENVLKMVAIRAAGELERNQVELELKESETKYRQIFDNTFDIMAIYEVTEDNRYRVLTYNAAEANLLGPVEFYQNRYIDECIPPELYAEFKQHYDRCLTEENRITYEETIVFQNIHKTFFTQLIPLKNGEGRIHRIIVISRDITENKVLQDQLIDQNEKLKLLNLDLIVSKDKAEESDRLKSAFLANMSHEIRTPMNGILGFSEILKDPDLTGEQQQEYIKIIQTSGNRMLNIINDIIDISRIESGLMKVDIKESNVNEQIEFIYTFFRPEVEAKGMTLSFKNGLPSIEAILKTDREKLYAILTNLVKNAVKYSNEGSIEFGYMLTHDLAFLKFYIKDTGIGIPKDRQKAIFERFVQADIYDKMARQGAGLGLAITKSFVKMLGGKIWVESEMGVGSTFYFTLPYTHKLQSKSNLNVQLKNSGIQKQFRKLIVLIADDDETSVMLLSFYMKEFSKELLYARTGKEAVEICRSNPNIDLILMDIRMPDLSGDDATRQIRQFNRDVVIIAQTAFGFSVGREKSIDAGCNDYITKPINKEELQSLIQMNFK